MDPQSFVEQTAYETSLDRLSELTDSRRMRLGAAREHVPGILWILLWGGGGVTVLFTYFFGVRNVRSQMLMTGALALLIAFVLFLIVALNNPFAGVTRVGPEPLEDELARHQERRVRVGRTGAHAVVSRQLHRNSVGLKAWNSASSAVCTALTASAKATASPPKRGARRRRVCATPQPR